MIKGIFTTADALQSRFKSIEVISNNLANVNTTGFKKQTSFSEILKDNGDKIVQDQTDFSQGEMVQTSGNFDLALKGEGFFTLKTPQGIELTRKGNFRLDDDGFLINEQGYKVLGKKGEINLLDSQFYDSGKISISKNGSIMLNNQEVDSLLISANNDNSLNRSDGLNFLTEDSKIQDPNSYTVLQGYLEESNVNPLLEMEQMIQKNKEYETAYKVMGTLDQSLKQANEIGKI